MSFTYTVEDPNVDYSAQQQQVDWGNFNMDPSVYNPYSPSSTLPQESKLVTYMTRTPSVPVHSLGEEMEKLSIDDSDSRKDPPEFVPRYFYPPVNSLPEYAESSLPNNMDFLSNMPSTSTHPPPVHQENVGGTTYFYPASPDGLGASGMNHSPNMGMMQGNLIQPSPYHSRYEQMLNQRTGQFAMSMMPPGYIPENCAMHTDMNQHGGLFYAETEYNKYMDLPNRVDNYFELIPMKKSNLITSTFRVTHVFSGKNYVMRRVHACAGAISDLDQWKNLQHPNVVQLYDTFTATEFNDCSLIFIYEYYPCSESLLTKYLSLPPTANPRESRYDPFSSDPNAPRPYTHQKNALLRAVACGALLPESILWNILIQITAALRAIHGAGLACRNLDASKVLVSGYRVRISCGGIAEALEQNPMMSSPVEIVKAQQEDLMALGHLALGLACRSVHAASPENINLSVKKLTKMYSSDLKNFILYLMSKTVNRSVNNLMPMIGARFYTQLETLEQRVDVIEDQLAKETDNGRLFRILMKFGVIMERPELLLDTKWAETGDRYILKLFRDYMFHTVSPEGRPWIDQSHIVQCLNELDAGTQNQVQLISRDEQSILIVTYSELRSFLDKAFEELTQEADRGGHLG